MPDESLLYVNRDDFLHVEYIRRTEKHVMPANHYHDYYEIYVLLSGERDYFIVDRTYRVKPGEIVFIGKNELHKTMQAGAPAHERLLLHFDDGLPFRMSPAATDWLLAPFRADSRVQRLPDDAAASALTARVLKELRDKPPGYEIALRHAVCELLLAAGRHTLWLQQAKPEPEPFRHTSPMRGKISDIVRYINDSYAKPLSLAGLAERFYVSPYHLSRTFKETTGFTLTDYVNLTRIKEAQRLLRETTLSVTEVAAVAGYDNFSHFGKTFKKITRLTPRAYRSGTVNTL
ncbi:helix-turn-helix domain-containing protein [Gordoniibacillus kamchatkensis]|uniref:helix-turn-helix domain-containing protein n=1 Tax=Gordoniibacillus kamchatkensis TaxID=1590651 RepID=UPI000696935F|nr:AraC family transcriptional regulator [Paenibacillus sp. VKM B-2647]